MDIENAKREKRAENIIALRKQINEKWVDRKILNHLKRNPHLNIEPNDFKNQILNNDLVASFLIKEPGKQNISEIIIAEEIKKIPLLESFINYSATVKLFIVDGELTSKRVDGVKSIDYSWIYNGKQIYATQKYTVGSGGAQDNQHNDIIISLKNAKKMKADYFIAIVDGNYYTEKKMNNLKKYETKNVKVCKSGTLEEILIELK